MTSNDIVGSEPNPEIPPVREFIDGREVPYSDLQELRDDMVCDDILIIDSIANRRRRENLIVTELAAAGITALESRFTAKMCVPEFVAERHPAATGLVDLLTEVYSEFTTEGSGIQLYDYPIVNAVASRLEKAKIATVFKRDESEGIAPAQQAKNRARAVELAATRHPEDSDLPEIVDRVYAKLVPLTVAIQQEEFANTRLVPT